MYPVINHWVEPLVVVGLGANEPVYILMALAAVPRREAASKICCADGLDAQGHIAQLLNGERK